MKMLLVPAVLILAIAVIGCGKRTTHGDADGLILQTTARLKELEERLKIFEDYARTEIRADSFQARLAYGKTGRFKISRGKTIEETLILDTQTGAVWAFQRFVGGGGLYTEEVANSDIPNLCDFEGDEGPMSCNQPRMTYVELPGRELFEFERKLNLRTLVPKKD